MGGYGSGGGRGAAKTDESHKLDLAEFERDWFERRRLGQLTWSRCGHKTGSISYQLDPNFIELSYTIGQAPDRRDVRERFHISRTEQPLGGFRMWIVCRGCGRRCRVLIGGRFFRCRLCYGATYASQYERIRCRGLAKAEKAREKLGAEPGICNHWPRKPKGMHWKTFSRLHTLQDAHSMAVFGCIADSLDLIRTKLDGLSRRTR